MADKYVIDTEVIDEAIAKLKKLEVLSVKNSLKKLPKESNDKGMTHDELNKISKEFKNCWNCLSELCNKTISFLGGESDTVTASDKNSANAITSNVSDTDGSLESSGSKNSGGGNAW